VSTRTKAAVTDTLPALFPAVFPGHGEDAPLDLPPVTEQVQQQITVRRIHGRAIHAREAGEVVHEAFLLTSRSGVSTTRLATMMTVEIAGKIGVIS